MSELKQEGNNVHFQLIECTTAKYICSKAVFRPVLEDQCSVHFVGVGVTCNYTFRRNYV